MTKRILQRPKARDDLLAIWLYIAADSVDFADNMIERVEQRLIILSENPMLGRSRPELGERLRSFLIGNYVIFYEPLPDGIDVVRVLHGARDIGSMIPLDDLSRD